jgi:hypothetical protein
MQANALVDNTVRFPLRLLADGPFTTLVQVSLLVLASPVDTWDWDARLRREVRISSFDVQPGGDLLQSAAVAVYSRLLLEPTKTTGAQWRCGRTYSESRSD